MPVHGGSPSHKAGTLRTSSLSSRLLRHASFAELLSLLLWSVAAAREGDCLALHEATFDTLWSLVLCKLCGPDALLQRHKLSAPERIHWQQLHHSANSVSGPACRDHILTGQGDFTSISQNVIEAAGTIMTSAERADIDVKLEARFRLRQTAQEVTPWA